MMKELSQVSHYLRETAIRIDCNQLGRNPNTNSHLPCQGHVGSPLVQLRTQLRGFDQHRTLGLTSGSPHILTTSSVRTWTEWLSAWVELLGFAVGTSYLASSVRDYVQNDTRAHNDAVHNQHRYDKTCTQRPPCPAASQSPDFVRSPFIHHYIVIFHDSKYSQLWPGIHLYCRWQEITYFYWSKHG